ncbi:MAG: hypothetical protein LBR16_09120 [Treponema sp.]|jgi:hypothetical protein|nr:hypothetical protein [Treponema sp.]
MTSVQNDQVVDCVRFKQELHELAYKQSGAKNFDEYIMYSNKYAAECARIVTPRFERGVSPAARFRG